MCVCYARGYSAISHRAGVIQSDLECERFPAYEDSEKRNRERERERCFRGSLKVFVFAPSPLSLEQKSFPQNKLLFGTAGNPLNVSSFFFFFPFLAL